MLHKWNWKVLTEGIDWTPLWRCVNARSSSKRKREFTITAYLWYLLQSCHLHASHMLSMLSIKTLTNAFNLHLRMKRIEHLISKLMGCEHVSILVIQNRACIIAIFGMETMRSYARMSIIKFVYTESIGSPCIPQILHRCWISLHAIIQPEELWFQE